MHGRIVPRGTSRRCTTFAALFDHALFLPELAPVVTCRRLDTSRHAGVIDCRTCTRQLEPLRWVAPTSNARPSTGPLHKIRPAGLEPATDGLENRCSIHLSYGRSQAGAARALHRRRIGTRPATRAAPGRIRTCDLRFRKPPLYPPELRARSLSYFDLPASNRFMSTASGTIAHRNAASMCDVSVQASDRSCDDDA